MKLLRFAVMAAVLVYAGWLAWPFLSPFIEGAGPEAAAMRAGAEAQSSGSVFGVLPSWSLWVGAIGLYVIAALMLGSGSSKAAIAYFLGFAADAALLRLELAGGPDLADAGSPDAAGCAGADRQPPHSPGPNAGSTRLLTPPRVPISVRTVDAHPRAARFRALPRAH